MQAEDIIAYALTAQDYQQRLIRLSDWKPGIRNQKPQFYCSRQKLRALGQTESAIAAIKASLIQIPQFLKRIRQKNV
jgi:hypothetical protein